MARHWTASNGSNRMGKKAQRRRSQADSVDVQRGREFAKGGRIGKIHGLTFDTPTRNLPEQNELYGNDSRKIGADYYVDDKAISLQELALIAKMGMESDKLPEVKRQGEEAAV